jgi:hypothetical protein
MVLFEGILSDADVAVIQSADRKIIVLDENALVANQFPPSSQTETSQDIGKLFLRSWMVANSLKFFLKRLPEKLREHERSFFGAGKIPTKAIALQIETLKANSDDALAALEDLNAALNKSKTGSGRKEDAA